MKGFGTLVMALGLMMAFSEGLKAQCENWNNSPRKEEAENAHVIYRPFLKGKDVNELAKLSDQDFKIAFDNWKKAYEIAPAADGQRPSHYVDGRLLYKALRERTTDAALDKEYAANIMKLYDEEIQCYKNEAYLLGRKGFDMFYMPEYGYSDESFQTLKTALDRGGNDTEYIVMEPLTQALVYFYQNNKVSKEEARDILERSFNILDYNIENNDRYGQYYESTKARVAAHVQPIEDEVFDCAYFKGKLLPQVEENPEDLEVIKYVYNKLRMQGCDTTDADLSKLRGQYELLATTINAQLEVERRKNNPGYDAAQLQKEGKYSEAIARYQEAINLSTDDEAKAQFYYSIAFIQTWQMGQLQTARDNARKAASLKEGWGKPYVLIGDIYTKGASGCGDDWDTRMAIIAAIDKYAYARSIDSEVAGEASQKISRVSGSLPEKQEGFMRGIQEGQSVRVGCWIGETVKVRYQ